MNIEEIDKWLDNEYGCSYTRLEELHDFLIDRNMKYQDEIERYKNSIEKIQSIYTSMQFSAPENMYVFIDQLGEILEHYG